MSTFCFAGDTLPVLHYNIGFDGVIPPDYYTDDGFSSIIRRHCNHPSIIKIKENNAQNDMFHFQSINHFDVVKIINDFDNKKHKATIGCQWKCCKNQQNILLQLLQTW